MRNIITAVLAVALLAFVTGCGKKPKVEAPTNPTTTTTTPPTPVDNQIKDTGEKPVIDTKESLKFTTVYFDFDKYNLREDAKAGLRSNVDLMKANVGSKIQIEGHCDERGTVEYNVALGEKRAKSARDYMVSLGVDGGRITTISYGKERPAVEGSNEEAWAKNRRAEFKVIVQN